MVVVQNVCQGMWLEEEYAIDVREARSESQVERETTENFKRDHLMWLLSRPNQPISRASKLGPSSTAPTHNAVNLLANEEGQLRLRQGPFFESKF